ncbi:hypothetical protein [Oerskovia paurometabola]|uniref:hypothetical protein n=1 Tax=Oerskovia paurometabola TaxID=162170 RepID=UPI0034236BC0
MSAQFWIGLAVIPVGALAYLGLAWVIANGWELWEKTLRRLRPFRLPAERNAHLGAYVAEWPGKVRQLTLPGAWVIVMTERPTGEAFDQRVKATRARIRGVQG